jgi:uncharacterized protein (TIGR00369 family)
MEPTTSDDGAATIALIEQIPDGWKKAMGIRFVRASPGELVAELDIGPEHRQPLGIVHGGVHAGLIETVASVGASLSVLPLGKVAVGLDNHTSFLHAVREGRLRATGRALSGGKKSQLWQVDVEDARGRLVSTGRVRLLVIDQDAPLAGKPAALEP